MSEFYSHGPDDEPLAEGSRTDHRYLLSILMKKRDDQLDRLDRIESKIAVVVAGAFAALGFSLEKSGTALDMFTAALFLVPLTILLVSLLPATYMDAPDATEFHKKFAQYPIASLSTASEAIAKLYAPNEAKLVSKVNGLWWGIVLLIVVAFIIVGARCFESLAGNERTSLGKPRAGIGTGTRYGRGPGAANKTPKTSSPHSKNDDVSRPPR